MGPWSGKARGWLLKASFVTFFALGLLGREQTQHPNKPCVWGKERQPEGPSPGALVFLPASGSQQLACSLGLACLVASPICDVLRCRVPAGLTAKPRRENPGESGILVDLEPVTSLTQCPNCNMEWNRYSLRVPGASRARAPILDSVRGEAGSPRRPCWPRILAAAVAGRPRTGRQAGGRVLQPRC